MPVPGRGELTLGEIEGFFEKSILFLSGIRSIQITGGACAGLVGAALRSLADPRSFGVG